MSTPSSAIVFALLCFGLALNGAVICPGPRAIPLTENLFQAEIKQDAFYWKDDAKKNYFPHIIEKWSACQFQNAQEFGFPNNFTSGKFNVWAYFRVYNPQKSDSELLLGGHIDTDSVWIKEDGFWQGYHITAENFTIRNPESLVNGYRLFNHKISSGDTLDILFKQQNLQYNEGNMMPSLNVSNNYVTRYFKYNKGKIGFYFGVSCFILSILVLILILLFFFKNKVILFYMVYLIALFLVNIRNFEWLNMYSELNFGSIDWYHTKVFHTAAIFLSYIYFVIYFLEFKIKYSHQVLKWFTGVILLAIFLEIVFIHDFPQWSYLVYYIMRILISTVSLIFVYLIWRVDHPLAKYIFVGTFILVAAEFLSNFLPSPWNSLLPTFAVVIEVIIFTLVLGHWALIIYTDQKTTIGENERTIVKKIEEIAVMRKEFAQDIHDELGSTLTKLNLEAYILTNASDVKSSNLSGIQKNLNYLSRQIRGMIWLFDDEISSFSELQALMREIANDFLSNTKITAAFDFEDKHGGQLISLKIRRHITSILKEALANTVKHSEANRVDLSCGIENGSRFVFSYKDNGSKKVGTEHVRGNGLKNMKIRSAKMGGHLRFDNDDGFGIIVIIEDIHATE